MKYFFIIFFLLACESKEINDAKQTVEQVYNESKAGIEKAKGYYNQGKEVVKENVNKLKEETKGAKEQINKTFGKDIEQAKSVFKK